VVGDRDLPARWPPRRFNELRRLTKGITQRMLSVTLRRLERDGLVSRIVFQPSRRRSLTDRGRSLHDVLTQLVEWTRVHLDGIQQSRAEFDSSTSTRG
jgi:DNA-binding HxlR family transcriptional regulator